MHLQTIYNIYKEDLALNNVQGLICHKTIDLEVWNIRESLNKFPDFFQMATFIDSTHETLVPFEVIPSGCNKLFVPFQQLLERPVEVHLCERVNDLRHSLFHLLNCLITTALSLGNK